MLDHLKQLMKPEKIVHLHQSLIDNYLKVAKGNYANLPNDNYIFTYIGHHLLEANRIEEFPKLYFNLDFISAKIKYAGVADLVGDYNRYRKFITNNEVSITQYFSAHYCNGNVTMEFSETRTGRKIRSFSRIRSEIWTGSS